MEKSDVSNVSAAWLALGVTWLILTTVESGRDTSHEEQWNKLVLGGFCLAPVAASMETGGCFPGRGVATHEGKLGTEGGG